MDILKSKFSKLIIAAIFVFTINIAAAITMNTPQFVIEEDIMRVSTGNEQTISEVAFFQNNTLVTEQADCQNSTCYFDVSTLAVGSYTVIVSLNNNDELTAEIEIKE